MDCRQTNWNGIIGRIELQLASSTDCKSTETLAGAISSRSVASPSALQMPDFARDFHIEGAHFYANGHRIFLRGKHDAAVWPLTGHVEMSVEGWMKYLGIMYRYWHPPIQVPVQRC